MRRLLTVAVLAVSLAGVSVAAKPPKYLFRTFGVVDFMPSAAKAKTALVVSDNQEMKAYGGIAWEPAEDFPVLIKDLKTVSVDYRVKDGGYGGGSPRIVVALANEQDFSIYLGTPPNFKDAPDAKTVKIKNVLTATDNRVDVSHLTGGDGVYTTVAAAFALAGAEAEVVQVAFVVDSEWFFPETHLQTVEVLDMQVNKDKLKVKDLAQPL